MKKTIMVMSVAVFLFYLLSKPELRMYQYSYSTQCGYKVYTNPIDELFYNALTQHIIAQA